MSPTIGSVATAPPANAPLHVDFRIDPHARAGLTTTVPSMHGPGPLAPSCTTTPLPSSGVGAHAQIADTPFTHPAVSTTSMVTFEPVVTPSTPTHTATPHVKLPKLVIKKFNGDLTKWTKFWDAFSSSIDTNPALCGIDKFNYLISLLESAALEAITGLTPTEANYEEAVATLKKRFGNPQLIINRHMEALLNVSGVSSHHDVRGLRRLYDSVEAHVRGLKALKVPAQTYGGLLTSVLVNKLPNELRLIVTREMTGETWDLERLLRIIEQEIAARERAFLPASQGNNRKPRIPTASALFASNTWSSDNKAVCVYCDKDHVSSSCTTVTDIATRKEVLRKSGRCYVCLKRHHLSRDCRSTYNCRKCRGRHHVSICARPSKKNDGRPPTTQENDKHGGDRATPVTTTLVSSQIPILLQTARLRLVIWVVRILEHQLEPSLIVGARGHTSQSGLGRSSNCLLLVQRRFR